MSTSRWIFLLFVIIQSLFSADLYQKIRISFDSPDQYDQFLQKGFDLEAARIKPGRYIEWIVPAEDVRSLQQKGYTITVLNQDIGAFYQNRFTRIKEDDFASGSIGGNFSYDEVMTILDLYASEYPDIVSQKISIGDTYEGRQLWAVKISDNPDVNEDEPEVLFTGMHHAREPEGMMALIYFMNHLTKNYGIDEMVTYLVNEREIWCVPIVNPDGYVYNQTIAPLGGGMHRKNRFPNGCSGTGTGIDLNRNYSYKWGYDDSGSSGYVCSSTYRGAAGFSELETSYLRDFVLAHEFSNILNYHTYSNLVLYPFGYDYDVPLNGRDEDIFKQMAGDMAAMNGYTPQSSAALYLVNGSSDDWMYGDLGIYAFTTEIGTDDDGFWPITSRIEPLAKENLGPNLYFAEAAGVMVRPDISYTASSILLSSGEDVACTLKIKNKGLLATEDDVTVRIYADSPVLAVTPSEFSSPLLFRMSEAAYDFSVSFREDSVFYGYPVSVIAELNYQGRTFCDTMSVIPGNGTCIAAYTAENGLAPWIGNWQIGPEGYSGDYGYDVVPNDNYSDNSEYILTSETLSLPPGGINILEYWATWEIEAQWDWVQLLISTDGGITWQFIRTGHMDPASGYGMQTTGEFGYDGSSSGWIKELISLPEGPVSIQFRFVLQSDEAVNDSGFSFDDFLVWNVITSELTAGDLNQNGVVDVADVQLLRDHILHKRVLDENQRKRADLNDDQKINVLDLILIRKLAE